MPTLRPFRALRYDRATIGDLSAVICPPYDVISADERARLLARHPRNAVRIELPLALEEDRGDSDPYQDAADRLRTWRHDGTLRVDDHAAVYVYEERYRVPGADAAADWRTQRGFFALLRLEPFGAGIRAHERTLSAPKEDRLRLLRATATDVSPIVVLADDPDGRVATLLDRISHAAPDAEAMGADGTRHRIWALPAEETAARDLVRGAEARPLTVADGHHRFETALRYRDESAGRGAPEGDRPEDFVLSLVLDARAGDGPTILPTHRLIRPPASMSEGLPDSLRPFFSITERPTEDLVGSFSPPFAERGRVPFGLLFARRAYELSPRRAEIERLFASDLPQAVRRVNTAVLDAVLGGLTGSSGDALPDRLGYTHDAHEAQRAVESGEADAAFLLEPTPVEDVIRVAAAGALMPQKSTFFYPKAATGLVMYALE